jgi:large subunit ribosomal protein L9
MRVILIKDVDNLGRTGDVKDVAPGYARNYLLRKGLVVEATPSQMKRLDALRAQRTKEDSRRLSEAEQLAERIGAVEVTIPARVGEQGRLFGAVTNQDVAAALKEQHGIEIDRRDVELEVPIRTLGTQAVTVRLSGQVHAQLRVTVVEEGRHDSGAAAAAAGTTVDAERAAPA